MKKAFFLLFFTLFSAQLFSQYTIETPLTGLIRPVAFDFLSNNIIMTHKTGALIVYNLGSGNGSTFWDFTDSCNSTGENGTLGVCLDPNFSANRYIYVFYTHNNPAGVRVVRFTENNNHGTNPFFVFNYQTTLTGFHIGGNIRFGPGGKLYITIGETAVSANSQLLNNPLGKILRINSNGTIPNDNPFYDDGNPAAGNDDRIWAYGLRNSFDFCFSPINDSLYATENGTSLWDEVNFIRKGKNYGWPVCEGYCNPYNPLYKQPMSVWGSPLPALTGIIVYNSNIMPEFTGKLLVADNVFGKIYSCTLGNAPFYDTITSSTLAITLTGLTTLMQGPDGLLYALNGGYTTNGVLYRIKPQAFGIGNNQNIANVFELKQNYPNPFNPLTKINYELKIANEVRLTVFDATGKEMAVLVDQKQNTGAYEVEWDASNYPSGIYFYRLTAGDFKDEKKMVLIK